MYAYELLARLNVLTLTEDDGQLSWIVSTHPRNQWDEVEKEEKRILMQWEMNQIWK